MNKQEFYNIVQNELDKLEKERKEAQATIDYYDMINEDGSYDNDSFYQEQRKQSEYVLKMCKAKIEKVKDLLGYLLYIRITSLTDFEVEEYREQSIGELIGKIEELREQKEYDENVIKELKDRQKHLISKLSSVSEEERRAAIVEAKEIFEELRKYSMVPVEGDIEEIIEELESQIEILKKKDIEEIYEDLLSKIPNLEKCRQLKSRESNGYSDFFIEISEEYNKVKKMANLSKEKQALESLADPIATKEEQNEINEIIKELPQSFSKILSFDINEEYTLDKKTIKELAEKCEKYASVIKKIQEKFCSVFYERNIADGVSSKLLDMIYTRNFSLSNPIDSNIFKKFEDIISPYEMAELTTLLREKEELSKKIIKMENIKAEIRKLDSNISSLQNSIFDDITEYYIEKLEEIFEIFKPNELGLASDNHIDLKDMLVIHNVKKLFSSKETIIDFAENVLNLFASVTNNLNKLLNVLSEVNKRIKQQEQEKKENINEVKDQIKNLGSIEFDMDIPYMGTTKEEIEDFIINNVAQQKQDEVATKIEKEARRNLEEKELDGLDPDYLEELRVLRETLKNLNLQEENNEEYEDTHKSL